MKGLIKTTNERVVLIRKGNEILNSGDFKTAERIFLTVKYDDGLIRIGDHYYKEGNILDALRLYRLTSTNKTKILYERFAKIIKIMMTEVKNEI